MCGLKSKVRRKVQNLTKFAGSIPSPLLRAWLMTAFCALAGLWTWRRSQSFYRALAAAFVTGFIASYFSSDRPYQITYVLIVATILILEYRRWMWLLPPLFLFWANCHGGFFMGFVVLGTYCAESLWRRLRGQPEAGERRLWLVTAICVRSEEHTSELQSLRHLVCRLLLE